MDTEPAAIDLKTAFALMKQVVEEVGPDHVYRRQPDVVRCQYVHDTEPGCLVGHILHRHGVSLETLARHEGQSAAMFVGTLATGEAAAMLSHAQSFQDAGLTWSETYRNTLRTFGPNAKETVNEA